MIKIVCQETSALEQPLSRKRASRYFILSREYNNKAIRQRYGYFINSKTKALFCKWCRAMRYTTKKRPTITEYLRYRFREHGKDIARVEFIKYSVCLSSRRRRRRRRRFDGAGTVYAKCDSIWMFIALYKGTTSSTACAKKCICISVQRHHERRD